MGIGTSDIYPPISDIRILRKFVALMAGVAQLVEPRIVVPVVAGSSPVARPIVNAASAAAVAAFAFSEGSLPPTAYL